MDNAGAVSVLTFPGALHTTVTGINAGGEIVGNYDLDGYQYHGTEQGFVATPAALTTPEPGAAVLTAAGMIVLAAASRRRARPLG